MELISLFLIRYAPRRRNISYKRYGLNDTYILLMHFFARWSGFSYFFFYKFCEFQFELHVKLDLYYTNEQKTCPSVRVGHEYQI
jgi:hypothetical protein